MVERINPQGQPSDVARWFWLIIPSNFGETRERVRDRMNERMNE